SSQGSLLSSAALEFSASAALASHRDAQVPQHRIDVRRASAERPEAVDRVAAAAHLQDLAAVAAPRRAVEHPRFLEGAEGVGGKHVGPRVTVITRGISAAEDV